MKNAHKQREKRRRESRELVAAVSNAVCPNCHESITQGGHFVPPSLGEPGFFTCEAQTEDSKP